MVLLSIYPYNKRTTRESLREKVRGGKKYMAQKKSSGKLKEKKGRGRPFQIDHSIAAGQANHYRLALPQFWPKLGPRLLAAHAPEEVTRAIREEAMGISGSLAQFSELIVKIIRDPKFPRARPSSQIHFLADSLGAQGFVTPRRSREICAEERKK